MELTRETQDRRKVIALSAAALLVAGTAGIFIGRSTSDGPAPVAEDKAEPAEQGQQREGFVEMDQARMQAAGVRVEQLSAGSLSSEIIAQATVTAPPEGQALLTARADGAVVRITKRLGDPVVAGETVALLESRDAAGFVAARNAAAARANAARAVAAREQRLFSARITARQDLEAAQAARAEAEAELMRANAAIRAAGVAGGGRYLAVTSPISGRITEVDTQLGAYVTAGAELFNVADPRSIQIDAAVPSIDAQRIQPGDRAIVELPGGGTVEAVVRSATPSLNRESRTATIVLQPAGVPAGLTQGQALRVRITPRGSVANRIVVPEEAVQQINGRDVVFAQTERGFQAVPVSVGSRSGGRVEILEGLRPGVVIVTQGAFVLKSQLGASEAEE